MKITFSSTPSWEKKWAVKIHLANAEQHCLPWISFSHRLTNQMHVAVTIKHTLFTKHGAGGRHFSDNIGHTVICH